MPKQLRDFGVTIYGFHKNLHYFTSSISNYNILAIWYKPQQKHMFASYTSNCIFWGVILFSVVYAYSSSPFRKMKTQNQSPSG